MPTLDKAIQIAVKAHAGQTRKNGDPYILHPIRVMLRLETETERIIGILHDVVEDTDVTFERLAEEGFGEHILSALKRLTHAKEVPYEDYVDQIATNPLARAAKLADLEDNMNLRELPELTEKDLAREAKYHRAWQRLKQAE